MLPLGPVMQYTAEHPADPLTLAFYIPAGESAGVSTLYEDDGATNDYKNGAFCLTRYQYGWDAPGNLIITLEAPQGTYRPQRRQLWLEVHLPLAASQRQPAVQRVLLNGAALPERGASDTLPGWSARATRSEVIVTIQLEETWEERTVEVRLGAGAGSRRRA
jgi:hypothetical protein